MCIIYIYIYIYIANYFYNWLPLQEVRQVPQPQYQRHTSRIPTVKAAAQLPHRWQLDKPLCRWM